MRVLFTAPFLLGVLLGGPGDDLYLDWAAVLENRVRGEEVDYRGLQGSRKSLDRFVERLGSISRASYSAWTREERIAFWINAYNALALRIVIDHYPIRSRFIRSLVYPANSIQQIPGVWDEIRFPVMGRRLSLNQIEHEILRAEFSEPRIHFALVCASRGCPPLRNRPYRGDGLEQALEEQSAIFLSRPRNLTIDRKQGVLHLSSIFKWFGEDFETPGQARKARGERQRSRKDPIEQGVLDYLIDYVSPEDRNFLLEGRYRVRYIDYDWRLNDTAKP